MPTVAVTTLRPTPFNFVIIPCESTSIVSGLLDVHTTDRSVSAGVTIAIALKYRPYCHRTVIKLYLNSRCYSSPFCSVCFNMRCLYSRIRQMNIHLICIRIFADINSICHTLPQSEQIITAQETIIGINLFFISSLHTATDF